MTIIHNSGTDISPLKKNLEEISKKLLGSSLKINTYEQFLMLSEKNVIIAFKKALKEHSGTNLLLLVLPRSLKTSYPIFKQVLLTKEGLNILSQFIVEDNLQKKNAKFIHTKLLFQILYKGGNILWAPEYNSKLREKLNKTCLLSLSSACQDEVNVISGCATKNTTFTLHSSKSFVVEKEKNQYSYMIEVAEQCIQAYFDRNQEAPRQIIMFMSAFPTGQVNLIRENFAEKLM